MLGCGWGRRMMSEAVTDIGGRQGAVIPKQFEFHSLAGVFPLMAAEAIASLAEDISEHGLREPVVIYQGKILDGRNRYLAISRYDTGAKFRTIEYTGDDPTAFVVSVNLHRRHLDDNQRAMVGARLANLKLGTNQYLEQVDVPFGTSTSQADAAELVNVSKR